MAVAARQRALRLGAPPERFLKGVHVGHGLAKLRTEGTLSTSSITRSERQTGYKPVGGVDRLSQAPPDTDQRQKAPERTDNPGQRVGPAVRLLSELDVNAHLEQGLAHHADGDTDKAERGVLQDGDP